MFNFKKSSVHLLHTCTKHICYKIIKPEKENTRVYKYLTMIRQ